MRLVKLLPAKNFDYLIVRMRIFPLIVWTCALTSDHRMACTIACMGCAFLLNHDLLGVKGSDGIIGTIGPIMCGEIKKSRSGPPAWHSTKQLQASTATAIFGPIL